MIENLYDALQTGKWGKRPSFSEILFKYKIIFECLYFLMNSIYSWTIGEAFSFRHRSFNVYLDFNLIVMQMLNFRLLGMVTFDASLPQLSNNYQVR